MQTRDTTQSSAPEVTSPDPEVERLAREVAELRAARVADRAELDAVRAEVRGQHLRPRPDAALGERERLSKGRFARRRHSGSGDHSEPSGLVSRRRLFGLLGGAAAAGAGLAVAGSTLTADPAGAVNPNLILDQSNVGTVTTDLTGSINQASTLTIENTDNHGTSHALAATTTQGVAVLGTCNGAGPGVYGIGAAGYGGRFQTNAGGTSAGAQLVLSPGGTAGVPTGGSHAAGELWVDSNNLLFYCVTAGTPGNWVEMTFGGKLQSIPPARVYDSRIGQLPTTGPKSQITNGNIVSVDVTGAQAAGGPSGVPPGSLSVLGNITVVNGPNPVFLTVFAEGTTPPATSNVNAGGSVVVANSFTSDLGTSNGISIQCGGGPTDFIIDIFGFYL